MRMNRQHVEAKIGIVNRMLGFEDTEYRAVGSVHLDGAYGGWAVYKVDNEAGGIWDLTGGHGTLRDAATFLDGMITALRIAEDRDASDPDRTTDLDGNRV